MLSFSFQVFAVDIHPGISLVYHISIQNCLIFPAAVFNTGFAL